MGVPVIFRPLVTLKNGVVMLDGEKARVILKKDKIFVGCHDITPDAARFLVSAWDKQFGDGVELQDGVSC